MNKQAAAVIAAASADLGLDCEVRENYRGRNMYGEATTGITTSKLWHLLQCAVQGGIDLRDAENQATDDLPYTPESFIMDLGSLRQDSWGDDLIVY